MVDLLETKRAAMRFRILVEIAERQPAVRQGDIATALGVTSQAVSEYIRELVSDGYVTREGRSQYAVTNEGVDWLLRTASEVRRYADHVTEDVLGGFQEDAAIAAAEVTTGDEVGLTVVEGLLTADPTHTEGATGRASNDAEPGEVVGVTSFEGVIDLDPGAVDVLQVPSIRSGHDRSVDHSRIRSMADESDVLLCAGVEAVVAVRQADRSPDTWFAAGPLAAEAAGKGLDIVVVATVDHVGQITNTFRDADVAYEVLDLAG